MSPLNQSSSNKWVCKKWFLKRLQEFAIENDAKSMEIIHTSSNVNCANSLRNFIENRT